MYLLYLIFQRSKTDNGVCAKVRVQVTQDLVFTRDAFNARLELQNGETAALDNIEVRMLITRTDTGELASDAFSIGKSRPRAYQICYAHFNLAGNLNNSWHFSYLSA